MELQRDWPDVGVEAEQPVSGGPQPLTKVLGIGHGRAEGHDPHLALDLGGHVAHSRADDLQHRLQEGGKERRGQEEEEEVL